VAVSTARRVNDFLAAEVAGGGGRFAGFATIALQDVGAAVKELTRAVTDLGLCGVMVNGDSNLGTDRCTSTRTGSSRSGRRWKS
jgi:2,3-dihydroxybenzoate decarboxylase